MRPTAKLPVIGMLLVLALTAGACGGAASKQKALDASLQTLNATRDALVAWSDVQQKHIVDAGPENSSAEVVAAVQSKLESHRLRRDKAVRALLIAYSALTVAALDLKAESIAVAAGEAMAVYTAVKELLKGDADVVVEAQPPAR